MKMVKQCKQLKYYYKTRLKRQISVIKSGLKD